MASTPFGVVLRYWIKGERPPNGCWNMKYVELREDNVALVELARAIESIKKQGSHVSDVYIVQERISGLEADMETQQVTTELQQYFPDWVIAMLLPNQPSASSPADDGNKWGNMNGG